MGKIQVGPMDVVRQSEFIGNLNKVIPPTGGVLDSPQNVRKSGSKTVDYLRSLNSPNRFKKVAGIVGSVISRNLKHNRPEIGIGLVTNYIQNRKVIPTITNTAYQNLHFIPGVSAQTIEKNLSEKPISSRIGEKGKISEELRNIKQK